jgi:hypothetical protein
MRESPNISKKSIDLDKSTESINDKKNNYIKQYLMAKEKVSKVSVNLMSSLKRTNDKKETSKTSFDFKNDIKKELDKKLQFRKDQTANKIISSSMSPKKNYSQMAADLKLQLSPTKKNTPALQLKLELSPATHIDLKKELAPNENRENVKKESGKFNQIIPDIRKFSILDIPAFFPEKKVELKSKSKAYFLIANSE